jgi:hypothetical protein
MAKKSFEQIFLIPEGGQLGKAGIDSGRNKSEIYLITNSP